MPVRLHAASRMLWLLAVALCGTGGRHGSEGVFSVKDFGAKGDGITLDTRPIQRAIDECATGGGVVLLPPGTYLSGSLELRSNVEFHIQTGATLLGSKNLGDYAEHVPALKSYNDLFLRQSLLYAEGQTNIAITGGGTIDGQGAGFKVVTNKKPDKYRDRPYVIRFVECRNVNVEEVRMQNSASWMQQYLACEDLRIHGISVFNHANKNNDMMDIDGCRNVVITDCLGDTDDDGITLKSTSERITENVTISNCVISSHCNAIKTGTESTGGFRNVLVSNIIVKPSRVTANMSGRPWGISGIALTLVDGGILEAVSLSNIILDGPDVPIFIRLGNRARKHWEGAPEPGVGSVRHVSFSHISAFHAKSTGCSITGVPDHPVTDITLEDVHLQFAGASKESASARLPELEDQYPEATMWKDLPSYGFFVRHVRDLRMTDVELSLDSADSRPAMVLSDVTDARLVNVRMGVFPEAGSAFTLERVSRFLLTQSAFQGSASAVIQLVGRENQDISVIENDLRAFEGLCMPARAAEMIITGSGNVMRSR